MPEESNPGEAGLPARRRRRRWLKEEKVAIVRESLVPGVSVSGVARQYGIAPNQLFTWRRLYPDLDASRQKAREEDAMVLMSRYRALERRLHQLEWLLGKRTLENDMLRQAFKLAEDTLRRHHLPLPGDDES